MEELLQGVPKAPRPLLPYDTYPDEKAAFITFAIGEEFVALPLALLAKASLQSNFRSLSLEFGSILVQITGKDLDELFEAILVSKVRVIRKGKHVKCSIDSIRVDEITLV